MSQNKTTPNDNIITLKYVRPCPKKRELGHTNFIFNGTVIGYMIQDRSKFRAVNKGWHFVSKSDNIKHFSASNRNKIIHHVTSNINNHDK